MAKDGTMRGGPRPGQGRPRKALADKINDGTATGALVLPEPAAFTGEDVPPVKEYLKAQQKTRKQSYYAQPPHKHSCYDLCSRA